MPSVRLSNDSLLLRVKYYVEMQEQSERDPNNLTLSKIRAFFEIHYKHIKEISDEYKTLNETKEVEIKLN